MSKVRIEMQAHGRGTVFIDGQQVKNVRAIAFEAAVGCANILRLEVYAEEVEIVGEAEVTLEAPVERAGGTD